MVADDAVGGVGQVVQFAAVGPRARHLLNGVEDGGEHVGVVVARHAVQHSHDPLEPHAGIDVLRRKRGQALVLVAVELDEHVVPDLDALIRPAVHQLRPALVRRLVVSGSRYTARTGRCCPSPRSCPSCCPGGCARQHADALPDVRRLVVARDAVLLVAFKHGDVQPGFVQLPHLGEQLPRPGDCVLLEVVAEAPVAEHLEEGVVVGVLAHVVQVVVLAAGADALLRVHHPHALRLLRAEEVRLELVHAGVGEQQRRVVVRHHRAARPRTCARTSSRRSR